MRPTGTAPAGGLVPPDGPSAGAPQTNWAAIALVGEFFAAAGVQLRTDRRGCSARLPWVDHGRQVEVLCDEPVVPGERFCAEHLIERHPPRPRLRSGDARTGAKRGEQNVR